MEMLFSPVSTANGVWLLGVEAWILSSVETIRMERNNTWERGTVENLNQDELLDKIRTAFRSAFNIDPCTVTIDTVPADISYWDSMGHVTLAGSLEQTFGLTLDVDDLMAMENVKEIYRILHAKLRQGQGAPTR